MANESKPWWRDLVVAIVGTVVGTVFGTWWVAWEAPDVGSMFSALGRWLREPTSSTRAGVITLTLLAITLGVLGALAIFLRLASEPRRSRESPNVKSPPVLTPPEPPAVVRKAPQADPYEDFLSYSATEKALAERFAELHEFHRTSVDREINWLGVVRSVASHRGSSVSVRVGYDADSVDGGFVVRFPEAFRTRAFALRKGDHVRIRGKIRDTAGYAEIDGESLELPT